MNNNEQDRENNRERKNLHDYHPHPPNLNMINNQLTGDENQDVDELQLTLSQLISPPPQPPQQQQQHSFFSYPPHQSLQLSPSHSLKMFVVPHSPINHMLLPSEPVYVPVLSSSEEVPADEPSVEEESPQEEEEEQRAGRNNQAPRDGNPDTITPPFAWATTYRATVQSLHYLQSNGITIITGEVQCKRCDRQYVIEYDLGQKFTEVTSFMNMNKHKWHDRAPKEWTHPVLPICRFCNQQNSVKPIILKPKKSINWLFLLLGQMIGCCTLNELRYFCKHNKKHRTGAKDRLLFITYFVLCKQLDPNGRYERF